MYLIHMYLGQYVSNMYLGQYVDDVSQVHITGGQFKRPLFEVR